MKRAFLIGLLLAPLLSGCGGGEQGRAARAALSAYKTRNAQLLTYVPMVGEDCAWGCFTQVCAALLLENPDIARRDVVFVHAGSSDDEAMKILGEYTSLNACEAHFNRG